MKSSFSKVIALLIAVMMLASTVGCNKSLTVPSDSGSTDKPLEVVDFHVLYPLANPALAGTPVLEMIKKKFGVNIIWDVAAGTAKDKLNIMLASGDYPEGIISNRDDVYQKYLDGGHLLPLDEYIDKSPNLKKAITKYMPFYKNQKDGKTYFIPNRYDESPHLDVSFNLRYDLWNAVGAPTIKTNTDLTKAAKLMKDKFPKINGKNAYPFGFFFGDTWGDEWFDKVAIAGMGQTMFQKCNLTANGKRLKMVDYMFATKEYHDAMKWANSLYQQGLADPESGIMKNTDYVNKMNDGRLFVGITSWDISGVNGALSKSGSAEQKMEPIFLKWDGYSGKNFNANVWGAGSSNNLWLTKKCKFPERIVAISDYFASEEGRATPWWGLKDKNYTAAAGKLVFNKDTLETIKKDAKWFSTLGFGDQSGVEYFGAASGFTTTGQMLEFQRDPIFKSESYDDVEKKLAKQMGITSFDEPFLSDFTGAECTALPNAFVLEANSEEIAIKAKADALCIKATAQLFLQKSDADFEKLYNKYIEELKAMKYERFVKVYSDNLEKVQDQMGLK